MKLKPLNGRVMVKQHIEDKTTPSGIILAVETEKKFEGTVVACGEGAIKDNGDIRPMTVKPGDVVLFGEYSGQKFKLDGEEFLMMNESDVIGILV